MAFIFKKSFFLLTHASISFLIIEKFVFSKKMAFGSSMLARTIFQALEFMRSEICLLIEPSNVKALRS